MKKSIVFVSLFLILALQNGLFAKSPSLSLEVRIRPALSVIGAGVDFNVLWQTNASQSTQSSIVSEQEVDLQNRVKDVKGDTTDGRKSNFENYLGFKTGYTNFITFQDTGLLNIGIKDRMMLDKQNGLDLSLTYESALRYFRVYGEIKYLHKFNKNFSLDIGLTTPMIARLQFAAPYGNAKLSDIAEIFILGLYDILQIGFEWYF